MMPGGYPGCDLAWHVDVFISKSYDLTRSRPKGNQCTSFLRVNWKKVDKKQYAENVACNLSKANVNTDSLDLNESVYKIN